MRLRSRAIRFGVNSFLRVSALFARRPSLERVTTSALGALGSLQVRLRSIRRAATLEELGAAWQRGFPSAKQVPITKIDEATKTVFAEIHTPCPLRGSGDVHACHRMMAYDRSVAGAAGGDFYILESQAQPGVTVCRVALRFAGTPATDLVTTTSPKQS